MLVLKIFWGYHLLVMNTFEYDTMYLLVSLSVYMRVSLLFSMCVFMPLWLYSNQWGLCLPNMKMPVLCYIFGFLVIFKVKIGLGVGG